MYAKEKQFLWCIVGSVGASIRLSQHTLFLQFYFLFGGKPIVSLYLHVVWVLEKKLKFLYEQNQSEKLRVLLAPKIIFSTLSSRSTPLDRMCVYSCNFPEKINRKKNIGNFFRRFFSLRISPFYFIAFHMFPCFFTFFHLENWLHVEINEIKWKNVENKLTK